ncbi:hypothetical protein T11_2462 [Trichinella zimbabwensis]|uniref:Uncharacterized protein n=1 Tax=Trichinella zimbabwensis TaxID=268475 RepID=A0A0V1GW13_9BILA|nr:hypothetical protein T11_2462 [Trichinella zimbabwensis]
MHWWQAFHKSSNSVSLRQYDWYGKEKTAHHWKLKEATLLQKCKATASYIRRKWKGMDDRHRFKS